MRRWYRHQHGNADDAATGEAKGGAEGAIEPAQADVAQEFLQQPANHLERRRHDHHNRQKGDDPRAG